MKRVQLLVFSVCLLWCVWCSADEFPPLAIPSVDLTIGAGFDISEFVLTERWEEALARCDEALKLNPEDAHIHILKAYLLCKMERFVDALIEADTAIALNVAESDWFLLRAYVQFQLENYDATVTDMAHIEQQEMSSPYFHELYGYALFMYDEIEEAAEQFDRAMNLEDMRYAAMYGRAMVTLENEDYEAAEEEINQLLKHPDVDEYAYLLQSQIYDVDDEIGKALESTGRALEINPDFKRPSSGGRIFTARAMRSKNQCKTLNAQ